MNSKFKYYLSIFILSSVLIINTGLAQNYTFSVEISSYPASNSTGTDFGRVEIEVTDVVTFTRKVKSEGVSNNSWVWNFDSSKLDCSAYPEFDSPTFRCKALKEGISTVSITMYPIMQDGTQRTIESNLITVVVKPSTINTQNTTVNVTNTYKKFSDVSSSNPYFTAIEYMANNNVIQGYGDNTFRPYQCVTRAEFIKMLTMTRPWQFYIERASSADKFPDVKKTDWYYAYIGNAAMLNWIQGYPDGTMRPNNSVNRVEAIKMSLWAYGIENYLKDTGWGWSDVAFNEWYSPYFMSASDKNLVPTAHVTTTSQPGGMPQKQYYPNECMTRGEVAELLYRIKTTYDNKTTNYNTSLTPIPIPLEYF